MPDLMHPDLLDAINGHGMDNNGVATTVYCPLQLACFLVGQKVSVYLVQAGGLAIAGMTLWSRRGVGAQVV